MGASGWETGQGLQTQWSGWRSFSPDDPDYGLWRWVTSQGARFPWVGSHAIEGPLEEWPAQMSRPTDLDSIREAYRREV
jgi:hypothetical protein